MLAFLHQVGPRQTHTAASMHRSEHDCLPHSTTATGDTSVSSAVDGSEGGAGSGWFQLACHEVRTEQITPKKYSSIY